MRIVWSFCLLAAVIISGGMPPLLAQPRAPERARSVLPLKTGQAGRILEFPKDHDVGDYAYCSGAYYDFEAGADLHRARGTVKVPAGKKVGLKVSYMAAEDTSWMLDLPADSIHTIVFRRSPIDAERLKNIEHLTGLVVANFTETDIDDAGVKHLLALKKLEGLRIEDSDIGCAGIVDIGKMKQLKSLELTQVALGKCKLHAFKNLTNLVYLGFRHSQVSDEAAPIVAQLPQLWSADFGFNLGFTDAGLKELLKSKSIRCLSIADTAVTAKGFPLLKKSALDHLTLSFYKYGKYSVSKLQSEMPKCVFHDFVRNDKLPVEIFDPLK